MYRLLGLILFSALACQAQCTGGSIACDVYGGLKVGQNGVTANVCPARGSSGTRGGLIQATITNHSRATNISTLTVSAPLTGWESANAPIIVLDSTDPLFDTPVDQTVDAAPATSISGNTIVYQNRGPNLTTTAATGTVTLARWYAAKITTNSAFGTAIQGQTRWMLCTPWSNAMFGNAIQIAYPGAIVGAPYGGLWSTVFSEKYAGTFPYSNVWQGSYGYFAVLRMKAMAINGIDSATPFVSPWGNCGNFTTPDTCPPEQARIGEFFQPGDPYSFTDFNRYGYALEPIQELFDATKSSYVSVAYDRGFPDAFNTQWESYQQQFLSNTSIGAGQEFTALHHDWNIAIIGGEGDNMGCVKGNPNFSPVAGTGNGTGNVTILSFSGNEQLSDPVCGATVLAASPVRAGLDNNETRTGSPTNIVYSDTNFHTKTELLAWLQQSGDRGPNYANIAALNAAWGSTYTSFTSTGTAHTGEAVGTGNGSTTTFTHTLSNTGNITCETIQVFINGGLLAGDWGENCRSGSPFAQDNFSTMTAITPVSNANSPYRLWVAGKAYPTGTRIYDGANIEYQKASACTSAGSAPSWSTALGHSQTDNTCTWINIGNDPLSTYNCGGSCTSFINTTTGAMTLVFAVAPENAAAITVNYVNSGWGVGTGLADEDGRHAWMPSDYYFLTGATATMQTDLKNFSYHMQKNIHTAQITALDSVSVGYLYLPTNGDGYRGQPSQATALGGEADAGADIIIMNVPAENPNSIVTDQQARLDAVEATTAWPDRPLMSENFMTASNDSGFYTGAGAPGDDPDFNTRALLGAYKITYMNTILGAKSTVYNDYPLIGTYNWSWFDGANGAQAYGVVSAVDDLNDGVQNTLTPGTDGYGLMTGCVGTPTTYCENRNNGNVVTQTTTAHQLWYAITSPNPTGGLITSGGNISAGSSVH